LGRGSEQEGETARGRKGKKRGGRSTAGFNIAISLLSNTLCYRRRLRGEGKEKKRGGKGEEKRGKTAVS